VRRITIAVLTAVAATSVATASAGAQTTTITFDTDASGAPLSAPCLFVQTVPLTDLYASLGVHFSGPSAGTGGAILNSQCANFPMGARSSPNFLAFNPVNTYGDDPETLTFDVLQRTVTIFGAFTEFTMTAFRGATEVDTTIATAPPGGYTELSVTSTQGIDRVVLTAATELGFVFDDLSFTRLGPASKSGCKKGGWRDFEVFKNQGDCVSWVATGGKNPPSGASQTTRGQGKSKGPQTTRGRGKSKRP
jgi:hypothetical protein